MGSLRKLIPWNETPLVEAMLKAKIDFKGKSGFKTLLVLTDGEDNLFKKDIEKELRREFGGEESGNRIMINMILFNDDPREVEKAEKQFKKVIETLNSLDTLNPDKKSGTGWW